eukprot:CAMPEP_0198285384 /NCGR_PEP_ID=MMETSP1449-20131203/4692_1 /TAXON_ID=420275 /ORGANISM="Attheya septentrionalis, Strain CCMP2084" /LENGTH=1040 /DNA_ID=CAMNT_0043982791 /DNA_START=203 /DNA_END=3325 /DNA_ORIENTATION=-
MKSHDMRGSTTICALALAYLTFMCTSSMVVESFSLASSKSMFASPLVRLQDSYISKQRQFSSVQLHEQPETGGGDPVVAEEEASVLETSDTSSSSPISEVDKAVSIPTKKQVGSRVLGSQELLMLPRQYSLGKDTFPQMNHVSCVVLSSTPSIEILQKAIDEAIIAHPLLRCHVAGDGEPQERIDLMKMVRKGNPQPETFIINDETCWTAKNVLDIIDVDGKTREELDASWKSQFEKDLDDGSWCDTVAGPLWKVTLHRLKDSGNSESEGQSCALMFAFNHAVSDQASANVLTDQIVANLAMLESSEGEITPSAQQEIPPILEESVLGKNKRFGDIGADALTDPGTIGYVLGKAAEGFKSPVIVPDSNEKTSSNAIFGAVQTIFGKSAGGESSYTERKSTLQFRKLSKEITSKLLEKCRAEGVTMTNALSSAVTLTSSDFIDGGNAKGATRNYKVLQSLDMRRFGQQMDKCDTVGCMAGSMDLMLGPIHDLEGKALRSNPTPSKKKEFWDLAREGRDQTAAFIDSGGPENAVKVFDFAMTVSDMNNLVHLTAQSKDSQGRAYSAGISNVGVYERQKAVRREGDKDRRNIQVRHGKYEVEDLFFATSHARSGCLYQVSCMTVNGEMKLLFHPASPVVSEETNAEFADAFIGVLDSIADSSMLTDKAGDLMLKTKNNALTLAATAIGVGMISTHANAYGQFYNSVMEMKQNASPEDFSAALNFWIFFAVGHPILQPILWISDVLHGSPGPKIADLVPYTYALGNLAAIGVIAFSKQVRDAVNILALSAFIAYIGAGLDGTAGLGDFNLQVDDSYKGQIVKGCPAYDEVRQPSMDNFNLEKFQGKWYEQKFHDWTQFKEVYDTTLDIKLTPDGKGWIDDFGVKGPAPDSAPLSWDKSPVANGAHYFLFGRVDEKDPPGILRESGFGVEFPDYIVDVLKDPETGEYTETIQFQCLERGGVRVFEGINFMSRKPEMTADEMSAMHARAAKAGMNPYGASEEQMHTVARRGVDEPPLDNSWQAMWRAIGLDKLLELLTESIEDGGR